MFAVLWGLSVTAALIDAVRNRSDGLLEHSAIVLPDLPPCFAIISDVFSPLYIRHQDAGLV